MRGSLPNSSHASEHKSAGWFSKVANAIATWTGKPSAFLLAFAFILIWGALGPIFHFSDTWQLVVNTSTTIITFLMVFLIQHTQNRDTRAIQLKLDELIIAISKADDRFAGIEEASDEEIKDAQQSLRGDTGKAPARSR
jgi:low affinity Fe/Cu permease